MAQGQIHSIETFGSVDGPGIRFVIFFQGCNMRCKYCHNADTWDKNSGASYTADKLLDMAERYRPYWGSEGGITVSGGEPLLQLSFLTELFKKAKQRGINTCIDTSAEPFTREEPFFPEFEELMRYTDIVLMDIKHIDEAEHIRLTGRPNDNIKDCFRYLSDIKKPVWIRYVLVPGYTDGERDIKRTAEFIAALANVRKAEVLPYHSMGKYKWEELGIPYMLNDVSPPAEEKVKRVQEILSASIKQ